LVSGYEVTARGHGENVEQVTALLRLVQSSTIALALAALASTGCSFSGLAFATDDRLEITSPEDRAEVTLPLTVRWRAHDLDLGNGTFGIFVDRAPQPPGEPLAWIARDDDTCVASRACPDEQYLAERGVYSTRRTSFTIDILPRTNPLDVRRREFHEFTIVLLDARGVRIGESAWFVEFQVEREQD
jgi:hypothetical protein